MELFTLRCSVCNEKVIIQDVKYHSADKQYIFCGVECSHKHYMEKRNEKTNNNIEDFNNPNCDRTGSASS